jgi:hypothetical protein
MDDFLTQYNRGFDGIIRKLTICNFDSATVEISVYDISSSDWANIRFEIRELHEVRVFQKLNTTSQILSDGIAFGKLEEYYVLDLNPFREGEMDWNLLKKSDVYFVAKQINYQSLPYSDCSI